MIKVEGRRPATSGDGGPSDDIELTLPAVTLSREEAPLAFEEPERPVVPETPSNSRVVILCGADVSSASPIGEGPRIDVVEMAGQWNAELVSLTSLATLFGSAAAAVWLRRRPWLRAAVLTFRHRKSLRSATHVFATGEDVAIWLGILLRTKRRSARPIVVARFENPDQGRRAVLRLVSRTLIRIGLRPADVVVCRTQVQADILRDILGSSARRTITSVDEPTDATFFSPADAPWAPLSPPLVFSAGAEMRDYDTFRAAVRPLAVAARVATGSPWSLMRERGDGQDANIQFERVSREEIVERYRAASVTVVSLRQNRRTCGISVALESLACGTPVIISDTIGLSSDLDGVVTKVPVGDAAALREAIQRILGDDELRARTAIDGPAMARERSLDRYIDEIGGWLFRADRLVAR
jgi:glycosyltransferase involved in cell wall biosynthesis